MLMMYDGATGYDDGDVDDDDDDYAHFLSDDAAHALEKELAALNTADVVERDEQVRDFHSAHMSSASLRRILISAAHC